MTQAALNQDGIRDFPLGRSAIPRPAVASISLACAECGARSVVNPDALSFHCRSCTANNFFCTCTHCDGTSNIAGHRNEPPARWECDWCMRTSSAPILARASMRTALQWHDDVTARGLSPDHRDGTAIGGFIVVGTTGSGLALGTPCSLRLSADRVEIRLPDGSKGLGFRYATLEQLEVSGRGPATPEELSGSVGRARADRRPLLARRSAGAAKPNVDTVLRMVAGSKRVVLQDPRHTRDELRRIIAPMFAQWQVARTPSGDRPAVSFDTVVGQIERLARLRATGGISDQEFEALRARVVGELPGGRAPVSAS
jgi:hypothetical protein